MSCEAQQKEKQTKLKRQEQNINEEQKETGSKGQLWAAWERQALGEKSAIITDNFIRTATIPEIVA